MQAEQPDVLLLQELKGLDFPSAFFQDLGYRNEAVTQKTYNGVAVLSRHPILSVSTSLLGNHLDEHARFLETVIAGIRVVNIYLPNGNPVGTEKFIYKLEWMARLHAQMKRWLQTDMPTVVAGDFNVIPEDIDCDKPASWARDALFQPEPRAHFRSLLSLGYVDAFRSLHPDEPGHYTYWDYFRQAFERNRGIRIDHMLVSPQLAERIAACDIDRTPRGWLKPSDHTPILLTLRDTPPPEAALASRS